MDRAVAAGGDDQPVVLAVDRLSKTYGTVRVLRDVSFAVRRGHIHALVGGNGSGKSTLVKIVAGVVHADEGGTITTALGPRPAHRQTPAVARQAGVHFVHQDAGVFLDMTVAENLCMGAGFVTGAAGAIRWREVRRRAERVLERFEIAAHPDLPLGRLRPAERMMVAIARALQHQEAEDEGVLVLDEPTASLAVSEVRLLLNGLRRYACRGQAVLFITHRLDEVIAVADTVTVLRDGVHLVTRPAVGLDAHDLAALVVGREIDAPPMAVSHPDAEVLLAVEHLSTGPLADVSFDARLGEIVGIAGLLGSGRTRLLRAIFGVDPGHGGRIVVDGQTLRSRRPADAMAAGIAYVPEDRPGDASFADLTVANNLAAADLRPYWRHGVLRHRGERADAEAAVGQFGIMVPSVSARMTALSGGNQQKTILARWFRRHPKVLLLDEPSQGVDVGARADIHALIRRAVDQDATAVVVSSDMEELALIADRVLVLSGGRITGEVAGPHLDPAAITEMLYQPSEVPA